VRTPAHRPMAAARRTALTRRLARAAALRLRATLDPGVRADGV